jgi:HEAT repeat protein
LELTLNIVYGNHQTSGQKNNLNFVRDETMSNNATLDKEPANNPIVKLMAALSNKDGMQRQRARFALIEMGKSAVPHLIEALKDDHQQVRWEAAKALGSLNDPGAAPALVEALMDESSEIRWLAAEALIALREQAVAPLLLALEKHFKSVWLRDGAHHVLHDLKEYQLINKQTMQVLETLQSLEPEVTIPWAAQAALDSLTT